MGSTMRHGLVQDTYVVVHGTSDPSDADWVAHVAAMERCAAGIERVLIYSLGGTPNSSQRRIVANVWVRAGKVPPISMVAPVTAVTRGVVTALQWIVSAQVRLCALADVQAALDFIRLADPERGVALRLVDRWLRDLGHGGMPHQPFDVRSGHSPRMN